MLLRPKGFAELPGFQNDLPARRQIAMSSIISVLKKNICVLVFGIIWFIPRIPPRLQRGVWPIVTKRGARDAMVAKRRQTCGVMRTAKACRPSAAI
jgi:hypothetical protein